MTDELCGEPTPSGKPCNMPKGHHAPFHRFRKYTKPMSWIIKNEDGELLKSGKGRIDLGYAITEFMSKGVSIVIKASPGSRSDPADSLRN